MKQAILIITTLFWGSLVGQSIYKSSIDSGGGSATNGNIQVIYTIGEVNVREASAGNIVLSEGFISGALQIHIDSKLFLEGPYDSGSSALMFDYLRSSDLIPLDTPYIDGKSINPTVLTVTGNDAIVDWVWVELRDQGDYTNIVEATSALLQKDGDIVDVDGVSGLTFSSPANSYYVAIAHRNHLGIITDNPINLATTSTLDLTNNIALINGGLNAISNMGDGYYALTAGDYDGNGQVQNTDLTGILPLIGTASYSPADLDMNGQTQNTDINNTLLPNIGLGEQISAKNSQSRIIIVAPRKDD